MAGKVIGSDALAERQAEAVIPDINDIRKIIREDASFEPHRKAVLKDLHAEMHKTAKEGRNVFQIDMSGVIKSPVYEVILQEMTDKGYVVRMLHPGDMDQDTARKMVANGIPGKILVMIPMNDYSQSDNPNPPGS